MIVKIKIPKEAIPTLERLAELRDESLEETLATFRAQVAERFDEIVKQELIKFIDEHIKSKG